MPDKFPQKSVRSILLTAFVRVSVPTALMVISFAIQPAFGLTERTEMTDPVTGKQGWGEVQLLPAKGTEELRRNLVGPSGRFENEAPIRHIRLFDKKNAQEAQVLYCEYYVIESRDGGIRRVKWMDGSGQDVRWVELQAQE